MNEAYALAVHGGAGTIRRGRDERRAGSRIPRRAAPRSGGRPRDSRRRRQRARRGHAAVVALEDDPLFNAGRGAVFTSAGTQEMDAAVMDGRDRRAGAVAGISGRKTRFWRRAPLWSTLPTFCWSATARWHFAANTRSRLPSPNTSRRRPAGGAARDPGAARAGPADDRDDDDARRHGTVGAVARDRAGNLAAATSTGGMTGKLPGRVGDSPLIGAGTFADNATCAISATGDGEFFIRFGVAHEIAARIRHRGDSLAEAARRGHRRTRPGRRLGRPRCGRTRRRPGAAVQLLRHVSRLRRGRTA